MKNVNLLGKFSSIAFEEHGINSANDVCFFDRDSSFVAGKVRQVASLEVYADMKNKVFIYQVGDCSVKVAPSYDPYTNRAGMVIFNQNEKKRLATISLLEENI